MLVLVINLIDLYAQTSILYAHLMIHEIFSQKKSLPSYKSSFNFLQESCLKYIQESRSYRNITIKNV
jgi:hypothetical protein